MDRLLYVSMTGAREVLNAQAVVNGNLANVSTSGFRADLHSLRSMPVVGYGHPSRVYAMAERPATDLSPGAVQSTGRDLDVAVRGEGWLAVAAPDGSEAYTRAGDLRVSSGGLLETGAGHLVLGNRGPVAIPPAASVSIGTDGTVSVVPLGQTDGVTAEVDRIKLVNPNAQTLTKGGDGLMRQHDGFEAPPDANVRLVSGALESSNVNPVGALVDLISLSRQFEMQVRMMDTAREDDAATTQLMRMS